MGRLGHSSYAWGLLGLLLGPIALLLALVEVRNERPWWTRLVASGDPGGGPVDVLVGIDGSPESAAATAAALDTIAAEDGYDLLVVGARGAGLSKVLLGGVAPDWPPGRVCRCWWSAAGSGRAGASASCTRSTRPTRVPDAARH